MKESILKAYKLTESIMQDLEDAESFGILNMAGGGIAADLVKYEKLDCVQDEMKKM